MKKLIFFLFGLTFLANVNVNSQNLDSLKHADYLDYVKSSKKGIRLENETDWNKRFADNYSTEVLYPIAPGSYLIKAKGQIMSGIIIQSVAILGVVASNGDKTVSGICGGIGLIGVFIELSGVNKIGKAGIALNQNGIGIKLKF
jgi:hypothetical protein